MIDPKLITWVPEDWGEGKKYQPSQQAALCFRLALEIHAGEKYGNAPFSYHVRDVGEAVFSMVEKALPRDASFFLKALGYIHDAVEHHWECQTYLREMGVHPDLIDYANILGGKPYEGQMVMLKRRPVTRIVKVADSSRNLNASIETGEFGRIKKYSSNIEILTSGFRNKIEFLTEEL
ncbi:hypothetical protein [Vibrio phage vB_VmeM-Yong XC32]|nr:hypothetical protein [Vibrio phage vB_VmeM-Yong XC31]QAX96599.1 hypothetical protein [Vibrio phage vB_VmeM-Yong XC32]QAX96917.1 hypothetical protein [Vibrio phage vB_VmeM-Yong MS31]QAX97222.1 hypothetical protein [Vibrio phage vB_VmeM-Yong MS32]